MADELRMALAEVLRKAGVEQADFLREGVRVLAQELMELELAEHVGAERHERTPERSGYRNGYRERPWDTRVGSIELQVPREREVLGLDVGPSESGAFWLAFLRDLTARGLSGVKLVTSDAHAGLKTAIGSVLQGAAWQRCRVHFMRDALALVQKSAQQMVAATIRTVFAQPDAASAREQWRRVADTFRPRFSKLAELLDAAEPDVLAYLAFPAGHWHQVWSNNPLERLNKEVKRRTDVVGIFPNTAAVTRLVGCVSAEQHDEWQAARRYFSVGSIAKLNPDEEVGPLPLLAAN